MKKILGFGCFFLGMGILIGVVLADACGVILAVVCLIVGQQCFCRG